MLCSAMQIVFVDYQVKPLPATCRDLHNECLACCCQLRSIFKFAARMFLNTQSVSLLLNCSNSAAGPAGGAEGMTICLISRRRH